MKNICDIVCDIIETTGYTPVEGALPSTEGIAVIPASGGIDSEYLTRSAIHRSNFSISSKFISQETAQESLDEIILALTKRTAYPRSERYQITTILLASEPNFLGQEENGSYMYGCSIYVMWFDKVQADNSPQE